MMNAARKIRKRIKNEPVLTSILQIAKEEYRQREEMFKLLGWDNLPEELKFAIEDDVKGYMDELHGRYSTNCALVQRRRESVDFWVKSFIDGICTLKTAVEALRIQQL